MRLPHYGRVAVKLLFGLAFIDARFPVDPLGEVQQFADGAPTEIYGEVAILHDAHIDGLAELQTVVEFAFSVIVELYFLYFQEVQPFLQTFLLEKIGQILALTDVNWHTLTDVVVHRVREVQVALKAYDILAVCQKIVAQAVVDCEELYFCWLIKARVVRQVLDWH